jgi:hypothetical protein
MAELLSGTKRHLNVGITSFSEGTTTLKVVGISSLSDVVLNGSVSAGGTIGSNGQYLQSTGVGVTWASASALRTDNNYTATAGQTSFSLTYTVGLIDVYVNGVRLTDSEYTASNGTSVVLNEALFGGESVDIIAYTSSGSVSPSGGLTSESDTLDSVVGRGNSTTNSVTVGIMSATNSVYTDSIRRYTDNSTNTKISLESGRVKIYAGNGVVPKVNINGGVGIATNLNVTGIATVTEDLTVRGDIKTNSFYYVKRTTNTTISYPGSYATVTIDYEDAGDDYNSTDAMWSSSTDRFTPTVAGLWYIRASIDCYSGATQEGGINITKNGSVIGGTSSIGAVKPQVSTHVYMNGSTDYIQFTAFRQSSGSRSQYAPYSWFEALLVKQAE